MNTQEDTDQQFDTLEELSTWALRAQHDRQMVEALVVAALEAGNSLRTVAAAAGVTAPTVAAIRDRHRNGG
jgi:phage/plasmid primase-like uncharacterized protein